YRTPLDPNSLEPSTVENRIESLRALGESTPGSISMFGVWMMSRLEMYSWASDDVAQRLGLTREETEARRRDAVSTAVEYYRRAVVEAPDNPWILTFAYMWDQTRVPELYARLLERYPDHPFASWWAYVLTQRLTGDTRARYSQL